MKRKEIKKSIKLYNQFSSLVLTVELPAMDPCPPGPVVDPA